MSPGNLLTSIHIYLGSNTSPNVDWWWLLQHQFAPQNFKQWNLVCWNWNWECCTHVTYYSWVILIARICCSQLYEQKYLKKYINLLFTASVLPQMCPKKVALSPKSMTTLMKSYAEGSSIHGTYEIDPQFVCAASQNKSSLPGLTDWHIHSKSEKIWGICFSASKQACKLGRSENMTHPLTDYRI